jgi:hypothetical protein
MTDNLFHMAFHTTQFWDSSATLMPALDTGTKGVHTYGERPVFLLSYLHGNMNS